MGKKSKKNNNHNYNKKKVVSNNNGQKNSKNNITQNKIVGTQQSKNKQFKNPNNNIEKSKDKINLNQNSNKQNINIKEQVNPNADLSNAIKINGDNDKRNNSFVNNDLKIKNVLETSKELEINDESETNDKLKSNNYSDKSFVLDESKKKDIGTIYDRYQTNLSTKNGHSWKILSLILFFIIIGLVISIVILTKKEESPECKIPDIPDNIQEKPADEGNKKETYLFLGDSIFWQYNTDEFFKDYNIINSGTNGITALETLNVIDENVYEYNPTTIFILLGTNDLYQGYNSEETLDHLKNLINKIHSDRPEIKINVLSILPINKTDDSKISKEANNNKTNEQIIEVNRQLQEYCEEKSFTYINMYDVLLDENGNLKLDYTREGLHITDLGYHQITMELLKYIEK